MIHCIGWAVGQDDNSSATAGFMLWLDGKPSSSGRYELTVTGEGAPMRIKKCTVVLDIIDIKDTIYLPI